MLSNVRIFLHGAKVNVLENLLNISLNCRVCSDCCYLKQKSLNEPILRKTIVKIPHALRKL